MATPPPSTTPPTDTTPSPSSTAPAMQSQQRLPQQDPSRRLNPHTPQLPSPSSGPQTSIDIRTTSPLPLTASQEAEVKDLYYARVRRHCASEIAAFASCATGRTFSVSWACRGERRGMNECMNGIAGRGEEDRAREEWFRGLGGRAERREKEEEWKRGQLERKREWWESVDEGRRKRESGG